MTKAAPDELMDDAVVEHFRRQMQAAVDRAVAIQRDGKSVEDFFEKEKADGLHITTTISVLRDQLREVGSFLLDFPKDFSENPWARRHWVYERLSDKLVFVLSLATRNQLQRRGYTTVNALAPHPRGKT